MPHYQYPDTLKVRHKNMAFRDNVYQRLQLLAQIHQSVENLLNCGERNTASQLLQETQNVAIGIGEAIEKNWEKERRR